MIRVSKPLPLLFLFAVFLLWGPFIQEKLDGIVLFFEKRKDTPQTQMIERFPIEQLGPFVVLRTYVLWQDATRFWIKFGSKQGIKKGAFVLSVQGQVIGRVVETREQASLVISVLNPAFKAPAKIKDLSVFGVVQGRGSKAVFLSSLVDREDIQGREVETLEFEGFAFPGLNLGRIKTIYTNPITQEAEAVLTTPSLRDQKEVLVLLGE